MPDPDLDQLDGRGLRSRLEETLGQNRQMAERLAELEAKDVLREGGFDLVKPEDLKGVNANEIKARAEAIQKERAELQERLLRDALEKRGFKGDELEDAVQDFAKERATKRGDAEPINRARTLGTGGEMIPEVNPEKVHGFDAIKAALEQKATRRR